MKSSDAHLVGNLGIALLVWGAILWLLWGVLELWLVARILLSVVSLWCCGYLADRITPRLVGPIVEWLYRRR